MGTRAAWNHVVSEAMEGRWVAGGSRAALAELHLTAFYRLSRVKQEHHPRRNLDGEVE